MSIGKEECQQRIYKEVVDEIGERRDEGECDTQGTSLDRIVWSDEGRTLGDIAVYLGVLDDRAVTPESLSIAQNELQKIADEISPTRLFSHGKRIVLIAIADNINQAVREYIEDESEVTGEADTHYLFVIDTSAKTVLTNEYTGFGFGGRREFQNGIASNLYELIQ
jgi:ribosomal protein L14E/L6E/L27E